MIKPEDLLAKIEEDDKNKVDLFPLVEELTYECTSEDVAGTHDRIIWDSPSGRRYLKLKESSRRRLIKDLGGNDTYFVNKCDSIMRHANMTFVMDQYAMKHQKMLIRCRDKSYYEPKLPEDLEVRVVCHDNYVKFDNREFVQAMLDPMIEHDMEIGSPDLTDTHLTVRAYFDDDVSITQGKWVYRPGIMIMNSEVGKYKPTVECILENTTDSALIRWPIEGESLLLIEKSKIQAANLAKMVENVPSEAYEQIEKMEERIKKLAADKYDGDHTMQLFLMLRGAKINDEAKYVSELNHHLARYTGGGKRPIMKMDMVQAVAACAHAHKSPKLAALAGVMLTQDGIWDNALARMIGKHSDKKALAGVAATEDIEES